MMQALKQPSKRTLLKLAAVWPWFAGCSNPVGAANDPQRRFNGIGIVLVVDAVLGAEMRGAMFYDDTGQEIFSSSLVARRNRAIAALGGTRVPLTVRAMWREGAGWDNVKKVWNEGKVVGDYTIPVAERIPNDTLTDIRAHGGALRLKFRLKPDGVLLGWDIERGLPIPGCDSAQNATCTGTYFFAPGGDFLETRY